MDCDFQFHVEAIGRRAGKRPKRSQRSPPPHLFRYRTQTSASHQARQCCTIITVVMAFFHRAFILSLPVRRLGRHSAHATPLNLGEVIGVFITCLAGVIGGGSTAAAAARPRGEARQVGERPSHRHEDWDWVFRCGFGLYVILPPPADNPGHSRQTGDNARRPFDLAEPAGLGAVAMPLPWSSVL